MSKVGLTYPTMSAEEKQWRAERDARTMAEAIAIRGDDGRLKAAQAAAQKMVDDKMDEALSMKAVAEGTFSIPADKKE